MFANQLTFEELINQKIDSYATSQPSSDENEGFLAFVNSLLLHITNPKQKAQCTALYLNLSKKVLIERGDEGVFNLHDENHRQMLKRLINGHIERYQTVIPNEQKDNLSSNDQTVISKEQILELIQKQKNNFSNDFNLELTKDALTYNELKAFIEFNLRHDLISLRCAIQLNKLLLSLTPLPDHKPLPSRPIEISKLNEQIATYHTEKSALRKFAEKRGIKKFFGSFASTQTIKDFTVLSEEMKQEEQIDASYIHLCLFARASRDHKQVISPNRNSMTLFNKQSLIPNSHTGKFLEQMKDFFKKN